MKSFARRALRNLVYLRDLSERLDRIETTADRAVQGLSKLTLDRLPARNPQSLEEAEFRIRSQSGEDGILQYIFSCIGTENRTFVEFGIQSGRECNSALLALSQGWGGLFIEGDPQMAGWAREYYDLMLGQRGDQVKITSAFITASNINELLGKMPKSLDLLSIDIDGNDYWIWEAITVVQPRVVVIEYNAVFGADEAVTVPYQSDFQRGRNGNGMYYGASLAALAKISDRKGYALVGCSSSGINAFFVRRDLLRAPLCEVQAKDAFRPYWGLIRVFTQEQQFDHVKSLPLARV